MGVLEDQPETVSFDYGASSVDVYLIVDQSPLLEECMHAHDGAHVSSQIPSACGDCEVFGRVETICVDHKVTVITVDGWGLAAIATVEELGKGLALTVIDVAHVKPGCVAWNDGRVRLSDKVRACG